LRIVGSWTLAGMIAGRIAGQMTVASLIVEPWMCWIVGKMQFDLQIAVVRSGLAVVLASAAAAVAVVAAEEPSAGRVLICSCAAYVRSGSSSPA